MHRYWLALLHDSFPFPKGMLWYNCLTTRARDVACYFRHGWKKSSGASHPRPFKPARPQNTIHAPVSPWFNTAMASLGNSLWNTSQSLTDIDPSIDLYRLADGMEDPIIYLDVITLLPAFLCVQWELYKMMQLTSNISKTEVFTSFLISFSFIIILQRVGLALCAPWNGLSDAHATFMRQITSLHCIRQLKSGLDGMRGGGIEWRILSHSIAYSLSSSVWWHPLHPPSLHHISVASIAFSILSMLQILYLVVTQLHIKDLM